MKTIAAPALAVALYLSCATLACAASLEKVRFIKISPQDAKAAMKNAEGKLVIVKPGDEIEPGVVVSEIAAGRIVLEEKTEKGAETIIVRVSNDRASVERMRKQPENRAVLMAPAERSE